NLAVARRRDDELVTGTLHRPASCGRFPRGVLVRQDDHVFIHLARARETRTRLGLDVVDEEVLTTRVPAAAIGNVVDGLVLVVQAVTRGLHGRAGLLGLRRRQRRTGI